MLRAHEANRESSNGLKLSEGFAKSLVYDELMYRYDGKTMLEMHFLHFKHCFYNYYLYFCGVKGATVQ